ncbi:MAG: hypothetical protein MJZ49_02080 [Bacteroidales bacterium]|nr:hypothetical protein [Bacteroidales bacterium]
MKKETQFLIDCLVENLSLKWAADKGVSIVDALKVVYNSHLYEQLLDLETGLYYQSADYNYIHLLREQAMQAEHSQE